MTKSGFANTRFSNDCNETGAAGQTSPMATHTGVFLFGDAVSAAALAAIEMPMMRGDGPPRQYVGERLRVRRRSVHHHRMDAAVHEAPDGLVVSFQGRLDERAPLAAQLGLNGRDESDASLVAAAWRKWGQDSLTRLFGEWNVAIVDGPRRQVVLAVDFSGALPLYYSRDESRVIWSSELTPFANRGSGSIDPAYLLGFLLRVPELGATPFAGISAVRPGTAVTFTPTSQATSVVWQPDLTARITYRDDKDYEQHFREVFAKVVADRTAGSDLAWAELSGGLDSSSIVCAADRLVNADASTVCALHYRFHGGNSHRDHDILSEITPRIRFRTIVLDAGDVVTLNADPDLPPHTPAALGTIAPAVARLMRAHGGRRLLSGEGGDGLMWEGGSGDPSAAVRESVSNARFGDAMRSAMTFAKQRRTSVWRILWDDVIRSQTWKRPSPLSGVTPMPWLPRKKIDAYAESGTRARAAYADLSGVPVTAALAFVHVDQARYSVAIHPSRLTGAIDPSYPYLDRRLVQFMIAVPFSQKSRPGISRSLQRRALEGVLPEAVRTRKYKANGAGPLMRMFETEAVRIAHVLSTDLRLADLGLVDRAALLAAAERVRAGDGTFLTGVLKTIAAEQWLRLLDITRPTPGAL